ncbi:glutamine amidotransferase-related protein [Niastella populi]|uniref:GMP synthase n=1 Tax=Niastella populi TaxID=550983 RepID=A0A1V9G3C3_9BACT|nr:homoserine O-succinyltransferase [Niastella populi]OQP65087.1 GMP synthase [Niastella populi]
MNKPTTIRVALLDLYEGQVNEGMRCIRDILQQYSKANNINLVCKEFDVRQKYQLPGLHHDVYISSGGPGSPLITGHEWERLYFEWIYELEQYNRSEQRPKKHVYFICHSFQLAVQYFRIAKVTKRKSTAFGVFPIHMQLNSKEEAIFNGLHDPFYAVDSRNYQVVKPDHEQMQKKGAVILAIEKERPHVPLERAIMGIRFNDYMVGTQFHPEADAPGMSRYLQREDKKQMVIKNHGFEKWQSMIEHLNDPDKILFTYSHILPNFLDMAIEATKGGVNRQS